MTTKFMYERDVTGAAGNVLPFSDTVFTSIINANEAVNYIVPKNYSRYIAEFSGFPNNSSNTDGTLAIFIPIKWYYTADGSAVDLNSSPSFISTTGEKAFKYVNGGSRIVCYKARALIPPGFTDIPITIKITLYAE